MCRNPKDGIPTLQPRTGVKWQRTVLLFQQAGLCIKDDSGGFLRLGIAQCLLARQANLVLTCQMDTGGRESIGKIRFTVVGSTKWYCKQVELFTTTHCFFAPMGGFALDTSKRPDLVPLPIRTRLALCVKGVMILAKLRPDLISDVSAEQIRDKSIASYLTKTLICLQAFYFSAEISLWM